MFKIGQKVVYPNHGVGLVEKIEPGSIDGVEQTYFHLRLLSNNSKVMVPKGNLDLVGLRPLGAAGEIKQLFDMLKDGQIDTYKDWKGRYHHTGIDEDLGAVLKHLKTSLLHCVQATPYNKKAEDRERTSGKRH